MTRSPARSRSSVACFILLVHACLFLLYLPLHAQQQDPYTTAPEARTTSSSPTLYGLIVSGLYPLFGTTSSDNYDYGSQLYYRIQAYYDAWQVGLARKPYGRVVALTFRSIGHDAYSGWELEYGTQSGIQTLTDSSEFRFSRTLYGFGWRYMNGYDTTRTQHTFAAISAGAASLNDSLSDVTIFMAGEFGLGNRIPMGGSSLSVDLFILLTSMPDPHAIHDATIGTFEIGLRASLALNFMTD